MIEVFRLGVVSRGATLWDGLDFEFEDGSATVVVGPPSCGKTLLFSILRGERKPDAGDVLVSGQSLYRAGGAGDFRSSCGFVPERIEADDRLTVNGLFVRSAMIRADAAPEREERRERLLAMVGLSGREDVRLSALSSSERVRAVLAAELLRRPKVLFADGAVQATGAPHAEMMGSLYRALAAAGSIVLCAERALPREWEGFAGRGRPVGPFLLHRLPPIVVNGGSD